MHEFVAGAFGESLFTASPLSVFLRIVAAAILGGLVAWIHSRTTAPESDPANAFAMRATLVLLAALIAMVTQVIGDNVARAFSLVGALSIVRFRTVVRDTRDTAFVIFSVAVGMAVGALAPWAAFMGIFVVGSAAFLLSRLAPPSGPNDPAASPNFILILRAQPEWDPEQAAGEIMGRHLAARKLHSIRTTKQGVSVDHSFSVSLRPDGSPHEMVKVLNRLDGVQEVRFLLHGVDEDFSKS